MMNTLLLLPLLASSIFAYTVNSDNTTTTTIKKNIAAFVEISPHYINGQHMISQRVRCTAFLRDMNNKYNDVEFNRPKFSWKIDGSSYKTSTGYCDYTSFKCWSDILISGHGIENFVFPYNKNNFYITCTMNDVLYYYYGHPEHTVTAVRVNASFHAHYIRNYTDAKLQYGDHCTYTSDCSSGFTCGYHYSYYDKICKCPSYQTPVKNEWGVYQCLDKKSYNQICQYHEQCQDANPLLTCEKVDYYYNKYCRCPSGYEWHSDDSKCHYTWIASSTTTSTTMKPSVGSSIGDTSSAKIFVDLDPHSLNLTHYQSQPVTCVAYVRDQIDQFKDLKFVHPSFHWHVNADFGSEHLLINYTSDCEPLKSKCWSQVSINPHLLEKYIKMNGEFNITCTVNDYIKYKSLSGTHHGRVKRTDLTTKNYGEYCTAISQCNQAANLTCTREYFSAQSSRCLCRSGLAKVSDYYGSVKCVPKVSMYDICEYHEQCKTDFDINRVCAYEMQFRKRCYCYNGYTYKNNRCTSHTQTSINTYGYDTAGFKLLISTMIIIAMLSILLLTLGFVKRAQRIRRERQEASASNNSLPRQMVPDNLIISSGDIDKKDLVKNDQLQNQTYA